jgi:chromosome segregation protein
LQSLGSIVTAADEAALPFVRDTLANVFMLEDESQAALQMQTLPQGACLVTKTGHVYSSHGLVLHGPQSELHGVLQRQREIEALKEELPLKVEARHDVESRLKAFEHTLSASQEDIRLTRAQIQDAKNKEHQLAMQALKLQQALEQAQGRRNAIREELKLIELDEERERTEMLEAQAALEEGGSRIADITDALMLLEDKQQEAERAVQEARERINGAERAAQEANYFERTCHDKIKNFTEQTATLAQRVAALAVSETAMTGELANMQESDISERLQEALSLRETREDALKQARSAMDAATGRLRELDEAKSQIEHSLEPLRTRMTEIRMKEQEARLNEQALSEALTAAAANLEELAEMVEKKTRSSAYSSEITRLTQAIAELGAVNLAALQELEESSVRKEFLDAQSADLSEAINTLENAIKRIDRETRELLQNTFDAVNKNFTELFPALFGGGNAFLKLTGDEILDAGVQVFAQPPGKRNQSIQLLSGGEKALTALSLVFSLFRLNPAPFCLLDEVDAPLDDSNTDRFCAMVKKMSESTQFMFITHNKVTMEMAEQLIGVTMNEPGVSRVVAVDIEAARSFVSAGAPAAQAA